MWLLYYRIVTMDPVILMVLALGLPFLAFLLWDNRDEGWVKALIGLAVVALVLYIK